MDKKVIKTFPLESKAKKGVRVNHEIDYFLPINTDFVLCVLKYKLKKFQKEEEDVVLCSYIWHSYNLQIYSDIITYELNRIKIKQNILL